MRVGGFDPLQSGESGDQHQESRARQVEIGQQHVDRTEAINRAVALARPRDIVLVAGKGHENYQEFADYTIPFDDIQVACRAIEDHPVEL